MAARPDNLTALPDLATGLLGQVLRHVRISGSLQYCFMPQGAFITDATPAPWRPKDAIGFHIIAAGPCWVELHGIRTQLGTGDIAAFPFGTPHILGAGEGGRLIDPGGDLPAQPWQATPIMHYPAQGRQVRILCGYVQCEATGFAPFRAALPEFIHIRTAGMGDWLSGTIAQIVTEVDQPQPGGGTILERLTEVAFLELLRRQFQTPEPKGWLAAILDPALSRALQALHADPAQDLAETQVPIITVATRAGYGTEAAFTRAFRRCYGTPPAEWRRARAA